MFKAFKYVFDLVFIRENADFCLNLYKKMLIARNFENILRESALRGELQWPIYLSLGQEACGVGITAAASEDDLILLTALNYRSIPYIVGRGLDLALYAKTVFFPDDLSSYGNLFTNGFAPDSLSIGANFSLALGHAWAIQCSGEARAIICVFGDGAVSRGTFHSAINVSKLWGLPVLWVCEVNQYAMSTPLKKLLAQNNIFKTAETYGVFSRQADGNNVIDVWRSASALIEKIKTGSGPAFLELRTYRVGGHAHDDSDGYRPFREKEAWGKQDPIMLIRDTLLFARIFNIGEIIKTEKEAKELVNKVIMGI